MEISDEAFELARSASDRGRLGMWWEDEHRRGADQEPDNPALVLLLAEIVVRLRALEARLD